MIKALSQSCTSTKEKTAQVQESSQERCPRLVLRLPIRTAQLLTPRRNLFRPKCPASATKVLITIQLHQQVVHSETLPPRNVNQSSRVDIVHLQIMVVFLLQYAGGWETMGHVWIGATVSPRALSRGSQYDHVHGDGQLNRGRLPCQLLPKIATTHGNIEAFNFWRHDTASTTVPLQQQ